MPNTRIPNSRAPLVDLKTGFVSVDWFNFFLALYQEVLMPSVFDVLIDGKTAENVQTTQYTSPVNTNTKTIVDKFTATNYSGAVATLSIYVVPSGGAAGNSNIIVQNYTIPAGQTYIFPEMVGQYLAPGDFISTIAGTAGAISIRACGRQLPA